MNIILISSFGFFVLLYMVSFLLVLSSDDWFLIWFGLEINMLAFIVMIYRRYSMYNIESCLKYFFIQSLGSSLFISIFYFSQYMESYFLMLVLSIKVGAGPFFFWFPSVCSGLEWISCFLLMSFQKVLPLMLMVMFMGLISWIIIIISMFFGLLGSFNQYDIKQLMAYSSIHHLGWILLCNLFDDSLWIMYMFIYCIIIFSVIYMLMDSEITNILMIMKFKDKFWFSLGMLSMSGMPPMLGFFLKLMVFCYVLNMDFLMILFLIITSVAMFYIYFRLIYDIYMMYKNLNCWMNYNLKKSNIVMSFLSVFGLLLGIWFLLLIF